MIHESPSVKDTIYGICLVFFGHCFFFFFFFFFLLLISRLGLSVLSGCAIIRVVFFEHDNGLPTLVFVNSCMHVLYMTYTSSMNYHAIKMRRIPFFSQQHHCPRQKIFCCKQSIRSVLRMGKETPQTGH